MKKTGLILVALVASFMLGDAVVQAESDPRLVKKHVPNPTNPATWRPNDDIFLGDKKDHQLVISRGRQVENSGQVYVGCYRKNSQASLTVKDEKTQLVLSRLLIAEQGQGEVIVSDGAKITCGLTATIGIGPSTEGVLVVDGGTFACGEMVVGQQGKSRLIVRNGGQVVIRNILALGEKKGAVGELSIAGKGSVVDVQTHAKRGQGEATISVRDHGLLKSAVKYNWDEQQRLTVRLASSGVYAVQGPKFASVDAMIKELKDKVDIQFYHQGKWTSMTGALLGESGRLSYTDKGELAGYNVLTVTTDDPVAIEMQKQIEIRDKAVAVLNKAIAVLDKARAALKAFEAANASVGTYAKLKKKVVGYEKLNLKAEADKARAALAKLKPVTDEQITAYRKQLATHQAAVSSASREVARQSPKSGRRP